MGHYDCLIAFAEHTLTIAKTTSGRETSDNFRRGLILIRICALRSLKVRYRGTALGVLWSFMNPLLMTGVYTAIFGTAFSRYYEGSVARYLLSVFVGLVVVTFFINATSEALVSIVANGGLLNKIALPSVMFPVSAVMANVIQNVVTTFPLLLLISAVVTHDPIRVCLVLVLLFAMVLFTTGLALALSAMFVFFRDLPHLWNIAAFILWLTSPLFYPVALVPPGVRPYYDLNPIGLMITSLRDVTLSRGSLHLGGVGGALVVGIVSVLVGSVVFRATRRQFMDLI